MADDVKADFKAYYLQRATKEFAEDLDKVRNADDFRAESVAHLVHALQQGTALIPPNDQGRIVATSGSNADSHQNEQK